jgi:transcriptional regulator with XRE-family HTH domain
MRSPPTQRAGPVDYKDSDQTDALNLGVEIRKLRKARGKSLADVALSIGRSVSFISQIERGQAQAAIADLKGIARLLGVPVGWFFLADTFPADERGRVVRGLERRRLGNSAQGLREELLSPDIGGSFETFLSTFEPGAVMTQATKRDTEEEGYVVRGSLDLWIGKKLFHLNPGDSFRIVREPFRWRNPTQAETVVVWVIAPPDY